MIQAMRQGLPFAKTPLPNMMATRLRVAGVTGLLLPLLLLLALPATMQSQQRDQGFTFTTNNGALTVKGYNGPEGAVTIPSATNGYPVTSIGPNAFASHSTLTSVTI